MSLTLTRCGRAPAWNPALLGSNIGLAFIPSIQAPRGLLWQDVARTIPAVADGDRIRSAVCPFTGLISTAASNAASPTLHVSSGIYWATFVGLNNTALTLTVNGPTAQVWTYTVATDSYGSADEISGYSQPGPAGTIVGRLFPDINTWYTGDANDVVAFSGGAGLVNGVAGNSNNPAASFKVIELTKATPFAPSTPFNIGTSGIVSTPRPFTGRIAGALQLKADVTAVNRALLRTYMGSLAGIVV